MFNGLYRFFRKTWWFSVYESSKDLTPAERDFLIAHPELEHVEGLAKFFGDNFIYNQRKLTVKRLAELGLQKSAEGEGA